MGIRVELHELSIWSNLVLIQEMFCVGVQELKKLLWKSNRPQILEKCCVREWGHYMSLPKGANRHGFQEFFAWEYGWNCTSCRFGAIWF